MLGLQILMRDIFGLLVVDGVSLVWGRLVDFRVALCCLDKRRRAVAPSPGPSSLRLASLALAVVTQGVSQDLPHKRLVHILPYPVKIFDHITDHHDLGFVVDLHNIGIVRAGVLLYFVTSAVQVNADGRVRELRMGIVVLTRCLGIRAVAISVPNP